MYLQALQATLAGYLTPSPCRAFINSSFNNLSARTSAGKKNANMTGTTNDFYSKENQCKDTFIKLDNAWHLWTSENFELIFKTPGDFLSGMNILGICAKMHKELKIITFELMSNHIHICLAGQEVQVKLFFENFKRFLKRHSTQTGYTINWNKFEMHCRPLATIDDIRNVVVYINRNGYVVHPEHSPYSYPWGANKYYFNNDSKRLAFEGMTQVTMRERRAITHSRKADKLDGLCKFDGYICPLSFCDIESGEALFRDASHYFYKLGKSIETNKEIAKEIGENIFYTDDELFAAISTLCRTRYGNGNLTTLAANEKIETAKTMHYDYNATPKQIQRMLRLSDSVLNSIFPVKA